MLLFCMQDNKSDQEQHNLEEKIYAQHNLRHFILCLSVLSRDYSIIFYLQSDPKQFSIADPYLK